MLSCKRASELMSLAMDRPLTPGERAWLFVHRLICAFCRRAERQLKFIHALGREAAARLEAAAGDERLPANARARISESIHNHRSSQ